MKQGVLFFVLLCAIAVSADLNYEDYTLVSNHTVSEDLLAYNINLGIILPVFAIDTSKKTLDQSLMKDIQTGKTFGIIGTVLYFAGFIMSGIYIPITIAEMESGAPFPVQGFSIATAGFALNIIGPILSCIGATIVENSMEKKYNNFPRNPYWSYYAKSWAYEFASWVILIAGSLATRRSTSKVGPTLITIAFWGLKISAEVFMAISTIGPIVYAKKAEDRVWRVDVGVNIQPFISTDGGAGLACQFILYKNR